MLSKLNFDLPHSLIAQKPVQPRDHARLLVYDRPTKTIQDDHFYNIGNYLHPKATLVLNNSKVDHCRWLFNSGKTELLVIEKSDPNTIRAMVRPGKRFKLGKTVALTDWFEVKVVAVDKSGIRTLKLSVPHDDERLSLFEHVPLPPYIDQDDSLANEYQTVYAKPVGSLAAPTAGLHFTDGLLQKLQRKHKVVEVTLHVGLGTFAKLTDENLKTNKLHEEWYSISPQVGQKISAANHITAVGTTSVRTLESAFEIGPSKPSDGTKIKNQGFTDIFIRPGYTFKAVDSLITNFHLPSTSLLMLVSAYVGSDNELMRIYQHAIAKKYRFYSFGDAMLVL